MTGGGRSVSVLRRRVSSLGILLACALLLRVVFLLLAGTSAPLTGDELAYQQIAANVVAGRGLVQTNNPFFPGQILHAWQAPLYPLALAVTYLFAGTDPLFGRIFGVVVSTATVALVYDFAWRAFRERLEESDARRVGLASAFLVAVYPGLLTNAHLLLSETLFTFFLLLAFDCAARAGGSHEAGMRLRWQIAAGAAFGLAALTRGIAFYFIPFFAAWIGWRVWRRDRPRRAAAAAAAFTCAALAVIAPYTLRNALVFHEFVLLETKGGVNLWLGNNPDTPADFIRDVWKTGVREPMLEGLPRDEVSRDRAAYARALDYIREEPLTFFARIPVKFADFWGFERNLVDTAEETVGGGGWRSPVKAAADLLAAAAYVLVMLTGVVGIFCAEDGPWKLLLGGFLLYFLAVHLVIFGDGRFHLPLIPLVAVYAGWLLVLAFRRRSGVRRGARFTPARVGSAALTAASLVLVWGREAWTAWRVLGS